MFSVMFVILFEGVPVQPSSVQGPAPAPDMFKLVHYDAQTQKAGGWHSTEMPSTDIRAASLDLLQ